MIIICIYKKLVYLCKVIKKQTNMKTQNTTTAKQQKLVAFAKSLGITIEKLQEMYKDPVKASVLNVIAEGL